MRRLLLLIFSICFLQSFLSAQSIYSIQQDASREFRINGSRKASKYTNQVIKQLALAHLKTPENTSFRFLYNYGASVNYRHDNLLGVSVAFTPETATGDVDVQDFNIRDLLIPGWCNLRISVVHPVRGEVFSSLHEKVDLRLLIAGAELAAFPDSLWTAGSRLGVEFTDFDFDEQGYKTVEKELFAIRDYNAAASLADTLETLIRKKRIRQTSAEEAFLTYSLLSRGVILLRQARNQSTLIVPGDDPAKLLTKYPVVRFRFRELTGFYHQEGIAVPLSGDTYLNLSEAYGRGVQQALQLSQRVDYYSSPFYYRLFSNSITAAAIAGAGSEIDRFAREHRLRQADFRLLSRRILDSYANEIEKLSDEGRFAEAADLSAAAVRFAAANPVIPVEERLKSMMTQARKGLISSYIRIVQKALDNNLSVLADKYLSEAQLYAEKYGLNAGDSAGFAGLYTVLSGKNIKAGNEFLLTGNFQAALPEFEKAVAASELYHLSELAVRAEEGRQKAVKGIYQQHYSKAVALLKAGYAAQAKQKLDEAGLFASGYPAFQPDPVSADSLYARIALVSYQGLLKSSDELSRAGQYAAATDKLLEAELLQRRYPSIFSNQFDSLVSNAGFRTINNLLTEAKSKLWSGEAEPALSKSAEAMELAKILGLAGNQEIKRQYASVMAIADETLCNQEKGELTSLLHSAEDHFVHNRFEEAGAIVLKARELIYARSGCGLNTAELNLLTEKYKHPLRWHETVKSAGTMIEAGDFIRGIEALQQAGALFTYYRLDTLGLLNTGLFDLAMGSDYLPFIKHATGYYTTRGDLDKALALLDKMRISGATAAETAGFQESLARELASRDLADTDLLNLKTMLKVYTSGNKWYRKFAEVYSYHVENR